MTKLTVAEYAELKGISKVAAYKRIEKGRVRAVSEVYNGREQYLIIIGEDEETVEQEIKPELTGDLTENKPNLTADKPDLTSSKSEIKPELTGNLTANKPDLTFQNTDILELLKKQIQEKDKQIAEKDRQIERLQNAADEKDKQLKEQFDRLTALLARSQELEAISHRLLGEGEAAEQDNNQDSIVDIKTPDNESQEQTTKKGFFNRLFKRKKGV